jgi:hypothetical protein
MGRLLDCVIKFYFDGAGGFKVGGLKYFGYVREQYGG